jgi:2-polyprenyl-3-methyl-5-hydroxy-6-metoxy-1,4-benzoquinol methylase
MNFLKDDFFLQVKDHSVSGETFELFRNDDLDMLATFPKPEVDKLAAYYESEDYISHTDGKRSLFEKAYHFVKGIALKNKVGLINKCQKSKGKLLDIGAGTGDFLAAAKNNGWKVSGTEPNEKAKGIASKKGVVLDESTTHFESKSFDVITMWHVLEHVYDPEIQIRELKRLVKPNGTIIIAVPNFNSFDAKYYGEFWAAYDVPRHLWHFSKTAIHKLFQRELLELTEVLPMKFDAFYVSLLSEKYKTGKMNYPKAFWIGLKSNVFGAKNMEYSSHIYVIRNSRTQK